ncbi:MAG: folate-binding protein YgfZ [Chloroflexi bacterium]|nr:folate-binding protein YgfZ [Chloroflexota bacterium]
MATELATNLEVEYAAAQTGSVMIDAAVWGRLTFTGTSRLDFLHRMSTNDVARLQPGQGAATVFLTPIARIIDRTLVYARDNETLMITSRGNQMRVFQWLRKYIFFNDDVQIKDVTDETAMISLYGVEASQAIQQISGVDAGDLVLHHWREVSVADASILIARADPIGGGGFHLIFDRAAQPIVWQALIDAGVTPSGEAAYQVLRVEAGRPEFGRELGDEYIPLEANLWPEVSFTKGCYTGQEIIARLESRQRLAKHLVGLRFEAEVALPSALFVDGHAAGLVTSVVHSPRLGWIGLGYLKTQGQEPPVVESRSGDRTVNAQVVALPFEFA